MIDVVLLIARLGLASAFLVAAAGKIADPAGSRKAIKGFGVPDALVTPSVWLLPVAEILVAVALIPLTTAWFGAWGALGLFALFAVGIAVNLSKGQSPDCHCFGQLYSKPISWSMFARELGLMAIASLVLLRGSDHPGLSALEWTTRLTRGELVSLALLVSASGMLVTTIVCLRRVLHQNSTLLEQVSSMRQMILEDYAEPIVERGEAIAPLQGLPVGAPAPEFSLASVNGGRITLDELLAFNKFVLLLFVSPNCIPCKTLLPAVSGWERDQESQLEVAVISKGTLEDTRSGLLRYQFRNLLLQEESKTAEGYGAKWTPAGVLITPQGRIAAPVAFGTQEIPALIPQLSSILESRAGSIVRPSGPPRRQRVAIGESLLEIGEWAPTFSLPDLDGKLLHSDEFLGQDTLLLFWNPECAWCQKMSEALRRWERHPPTGSPRLVFIASGAPERIRVERRRFKSLFLSDPEFDLDTMFGATSTPSAILIDRDGRIASKMATGLPNVLAMIGVRRTELPVATGIPARGTIVEEQHPVEERIELQSH